MADGKERKPKSFRIDDSTIKCEEEAGIAGRATSHAEVSNSHRTVASNKNYAQGIKSQGKGKYKAEKAIVFFPGND